jgi:cell wall-associated NlpC family hydrolase
MHHHNRLVRKVMHEARRQKGKPYSYGAAGPHAFDCSGLVMYVFQHSVHRSLPHNAAQQYHSLQHIKRNHLRRGDLIFTDNGYISHVGIFAGHHHWWVAPHTGERVHKQRIYHAHFLYARVLVIHKHKHHRHHHHRHHRH